MNFNRFNIPPDLVRTYGRDVLRDVAVQVNSVGDCGVCQQPLGDTGRLSLLAHSQGPMTLFYPAHAPCMASHTSEEFAVPLRPSTYRVLPMVLPVVQQPSQEPEPVPVVFVNPSVDRVAAWRAPGQDRWSAKGALDFESMGWVRPNTGSTIKTLGTMTADPSGLWTIEGRGVEDWQVEAPHQFDTLAKTVGHVNLFANARIFVEYVFDAAATPQEALRRAFEFIEDDGTVYCRVSVAKKTYRPGEAFGF